MYVVLVSLSVKPESIDQFEQAILKNASISVREEKNCHRFDVCQSENDPTEWLFYEVYQDRAAFDTHHQQPHFLEYNAVAQQVVTSKKIAAYYLKSPGEI